MNIFYLCHLENIGKDSIQTCSFLPVPNILLLALRFFVVNVARKYNIIFAVKFAFVLLIQLETQTRTTFYKFGYDLPIDLV